MGTMISQGNGVPTMTPQHHANNGVKTRFVDALFASDWETMAGLVHAEFELREPKALPYGGTYKGIDGFKKCWDLIPQSSHIAEYLNTLRCYFTEDPNSILVELDFRGRKRGTDEKFGSKVIEQFEFRDNKIVAIVLYWFDIPAF